MICYFFLFLHLELANALDSAPKPQSLATKVTVLLGAGSRFSVSKFLNKEEQMEYDNVEYRSMLYDWENKSQEKHYFNVFECQTHAVSIEDFDSIFLFEINENLML